MGFVAFSQLVILEIIATGDNETRCETLFQLRTQIWFLLKSESTLGRNMNLLLLPHPDIRPNEVGPKLGDLDMK